MPARRGFRDPRKSKAITLAVPAPVNRLTLFGPPLLLEGEDAAAYDALRALICAAIKPIDIIDEIFVNDFMVLQWDVMRLHRLRSALLRAHGLKALERFLAPVVDLCARDLTEFLLEKLGEDQREDFEKLSNQWVRSEPGADEKVEALLAPDGLDVDDVRANKAKKIAQSYVRREPRAVQHVKELLEAAGRSIDDLMADVLVQNLDHIERIDHLAAVAESRRNASQHEIERRRAVLGAALRRGVQEAEDAEFEEIEAPVAKGKSLEGASTRSVPNRTKARGSTGPKTVQTARRKITTERPRGSGAK